jgi:polysaccharide deacetylase 2 family uncharacterized protein YibQ
MPDDSNIRRMPRPATGRASIPLALPAPVGHVATPLRRPRRRLLLFGWVAFCATMLGFIAAAMMMPTKDGSVAVTVARFILPSWQVTPNPETAGPPVTETVAAPTPLESASSATIAEVIAPPQPERDMPGDTIVVVAPIETAAGAAARMRDDHTTMEPGLRGPFGELVAAPPIETARTMPIAPTRSEIEAPDASHLTSIAPAASDRATQPAATEPPIVAAIASVPQSDAAQAQLVTQPTAPNSETRPPAAPPRAPPARTTRSAPPPAPDPGAAEVPPQVMSASRRPQVATPSSQAPSNLVTPQASSRLVTLPELQEQRVATPRAVPPRIATTDGTIVARMRPADTNQAWRQNSRAFNSDDPRPRVAIVLTGLGMARSTTELAINYLPGAVTLSFSPYAPDLPGLVQQARATGHEVLIDLPMESVDAANDPGPRAMMTSLQARQNIERLDALLGSAQGHIGVASYLGTRFTADVDAMTPILGALRDRGFIYLETLGTSRSVGPRVAADIGLSRVIADRRIDSNPAPTAVAGQLIEIENMARERTTAVALARPSTLTIEQIATWHASLGPKGIVLAPVSAVVNRQSDR